MYKLGTFPTFFGVVVEQIESKFDQQVRFWAVLGPFIMLMTLFIMLIRSAPEDLYLALTALIGIPICWKWKHTGLALAFALLGFGLVFSLIQAPIEERFWYFGISLAIGMAFIVTSLSLEEVTSIISKLQFESKSRKDHLWSLDERYQLAKAAWEKEKIGFNKEINQKQAEIVILKSQLKQENENKVSQNNDQIEQYRKNYFRLESELQYAKNKQQQAEIEAANLRRIVSQSETELRELKQRETDQQNKIDVLENAKKHLLNTLEIEKSSLANLLIENRKMSEELAANHESKHQLQELQTNLQEKAETIAVLRNEITEKNAKIISLEAEKTSLANLMDKNISEEAAARQELQRQIPLLQDNLQEKAEAIAQLQNEITEKNVQISSFELEKASLVTLMEKRLGEEIAAREEIQRQIPLLKDSIQLKIEEMAELQKEIDHKNAQINEISQQLEHTPSAKDPFEPLYKQLREQFSEKNDLLEETRRELFKSKEALLTLINHHKEKINEIENIGLVQLESEYSTEISLLEEALKATQEEIEDLYALVSSLMKNK